MVDIQLENAGKCCQGNEWSICRQKVGGQGIKNENMYARHLCKKREWIDEQVQEDKKGKPGADLKLAGHKL